MRPIVKILSMTQSTASKFPKRKAKTRYWEIDFLRSIAVISMIVYHTLFDLMYLDIAKINLFSPGFEIMAKSTAITFFTLVGVSLNISYSRSQTRLTRLELRHKYLRRGFKLFLWGVVISVLTLLLYENVP